jgi:hypothetical protein
LTCTCPIQERSEILNQYQSEQEIVAVVSGFENCTTTKEGFTHLSHLTVGAYYLCHSTPAEAFERMRSGLLRFLNHHGVGQTKYKDRLTWAWIEAIQIVIEQMEPGSSLVAVTNEVIARLGESRITVEDDCEL